MSEREPKPKTEKMKISSVKSQLSTLVDAVSSGETRVLVERTGNPVAALVSVRDLRRLMALEAQDREFREVLEAMRAPFRDVPLEEIERETERAIAEVRAQRRAERERAKVPAASA